MGQIYVKASRRAKAYTRRAAAGKGTYKGFAKQIRKGGKMYNMHLVSKDRTKVTRHVTEQRRYGTRVWIMKGNMHGYAAYWREP